MKHGTYPLKLVSINLLIMALTGLLLAACGDSSPIVLTTGTPSATTLSSTTVLATTQVSQPTTSPAQPATSPAQALPSVTPGQTPPAPATTAPGQTTQADTPATFTTPSQPSLPLPSASVGAFVGPGLKRNFEAETAYGHVKELAGTIGIRAAGTPGATKAADYIEGYFKDLGLFTERPTFDHTISRDTGSTVTYNATSGAVSLSANILSGRANKVQGQLVDVGLALSPSGLPDLKGKIALVGRGQNTFQAKTDAVIAAGATAVIIYNNVAGPLAGVALNATDNVPVLGITQADGNRLKRDLTLNPALTFAVNASVATEQIKIQNVVGRRAAFKGDPATAPILIIGGHYDSVPAGPGANDNASGTAIVLELARVLQGQYPNWELRFIAFGGEEIGLLGSDNYAQNLSQTDRKRVKAMINIDMVTVGNDFYVGGSSGMEKLGLTAAVNNGIGNAQIVPQALAGASDHASFERIGIPVLFFNRESDPNYHQPGDTIDHVRSDRLQQVGLSVIQVIDSLARS